MHGPWFEWDFGDATSARTVPPPVVGGSAGTRIAGIDPGPVPAREAVKLAIKSWRGSTYGQEVN